MEDGKGGIIRGRKDRMTIERGKENRKKGMETGDRKGERGKRERRERGRREKRKMKRGCVRKIRKREGIMRSRKNRMRIGGEKRKM